MSRAAAISAPSDAMPQAKTSRPSEGLLVVGGEVFLAGAADGAEPVTGDVLERGAAGDAAVGIAVGRVVDEAARLTDVLLHKAVTVVSGFVDAERKHPFEPLNLEG